VGAEVLSRITDWKDRNTCVLFADGAGATVLRASDDPSRGILSTHLHADGSMADHLIIHGGGSRMPLNEEVLRNRLNYIQMRGNETFKVAVRTMSRAALEVLDHHGYKPNDVDLFIPHQANSRIIDAIAKRLGIPREKVFINLDRLGNTSAASIPIALDEARRAGRVNRDDLVLLVGMGAGLTWASTLIRW
jgi:3-oxoacyl-[acyl-carrier-protein] synthase-3